MKIKPIDATPSSTLYEQVADRIRTLISEGTLQDGDRLPSVRKGNNYFKTYDPETRQSNTFSSEQEIRIWLDQRHSNL